MLIGWITGCIPSTIPLLTNYKILGNIKFLKYLGILISFTFLIIQIIFIIDLTLREQTYLSKITTPPEFVIEFTEYIFLHISDVIKPILWLTSYPKLLKIYKQLVKLNNKNVIILCNTEIPFYFLWLVFLSIFLLLITSILFTISFSFGNCSGIATLPNDISQHIIWLTRDLSSFGSAI